MVRRGDHQSELSAQLEASRRRVTELERELVGSRERDPLTGLLTLTRLCEQLEAEVHRARRHGHPLTVALLDLDGFRAVNALSGYGAGDALLVAVAGILRRFTRASDVVARSSGDEFAVVMPETDPLGALQAFERVLLELPALDTGSVEGASASIGIAAFSGAKTPQELLGEAAGVLDAARASGGGRALAAEDGAAAAPSSGGRADAVSALATALLERDGYAGDHAHSLVEMAGEVGRAMGLDEKDVQHVRAAALLHDVGKVAIPDEVLSHPEALDDDGWRLVREHPAIGERLLETMAGMGAVARMVRHHHESFDGTGYPDGLAGEQIPIGSRIVLACDAYHAMTTERPYRAALSHDAAIDQLLDGAGSQFDPDVVQALLGYLYGQPAGGAGRNAV